MDALGGNKTYFALTTKNKDDPDSTLKKYLVYMPFFFFCFFTLEVFFLQFERKIIPVITKNLV